MTHLPIPIPDVSTAGLETVDAILRRKGNDVLTIDPDATVFEAIKLMEEKEIGALVVVEAESIIGLISERDYARKVVLKGLDSRKSKVRDAMTTPVVTVTPEWRVGNCMKLVTDRRVRHLPVLASGKMVGLISIGDLVNSVILGLTDVIRDLNSYIASEYPH